MLNLSNFKFSKVYKDKQIRFLPNTNNKIKESIIFPITSSLEETITFLNNSNFNLLNYKAYYIPYRENFKFTNVERRYSFNQQLSYEQIKTECKTIKTTKKDLKAYQSMNLIYDTSLINQEFLTASQLPPKRKLSNHFNLIKGIITDNKISNYTEKIVYIPFTGKSLRTLADFKNPTDFQGFAHTLGYIQQNEPNKLNDLKDIIFILHDNTSNIFLKFTTSIFTEKPMMYFKLCFLLCKIANRERLTREEEAIIANIAEVEKDEKESIKTVEKEVIVDKITDFITDKFLYSPKGFAGDDKLTDNAKKVISEVVKDKKGSSDEITKETLKELETNEELIKIAKEMANESLTKKKSLAMSKRDELIRKEHQEVLVDGKHTLSQVLNEFKDNSITKTKVENVDLIYDDLKESINTDFELNYVKKQYLKDQTMVLDAFNNNDKEIPMFIRKIEREDTSDSFTKKETLTVYFEDDNRVKHTFKVDVPKIIDDKYLFINGNKKGFVKQLVLKPVVKTGPDTVQLVSNYNKIFLYRRGDKTSPKNEKIKKILSNLNHREYDIKKSDNSLVNINYLTNMEYDEFAKDIFLISIKDLIISFNQSDMRKRLSEINYNNSKLPYNHLPIGLDGKNVILLDVTKNVIVGTDLSLSDFIIEKLKGINPDIESEIAKASVGKRYMYTEASVLNIKIPLILFLAYKEGLSTVLRKAKVNYSFTDKRPNLSNEDKTKKGVIQFADGYLVYDLYPMRNSLLLNALAGIPTKEFNYELFDSKEIYLELFNSLYGTRTIGKGLDNIYQLFLDPITLEVIRDLGMPDDFIELFLYANILLEDNTFVKENDLSIYRIRSAELINAYLYRVLADAYRLYKDSKNASKPIKVSVPQDKLIKELLTSLNTEDVNILNPIIASTNNCTYKGLSGLNLAQAYKIDKRAYSNSMLGVIGISSPYNASVKYLPIL